MAIRAAKWSDLEEVNALCTEAFWNEEAVGKILHPKRDEYPGDIIKHWRMKNRQDWFDWSHFPLVAEDENGRIVGFADWSRESKQLAWFDPRRILQLIARMFTSISLLFWPNRALYPPALQYYGRAMEINSHIWTGRRSNPWVLDLLAVAPFAQRKGYGQRLVQWGLQRAREEKAPASVVSSYGSDGFYLKSGFETVAGNIGDGEENPLKGCKGGSVLFMDAPLEDEDEDEDEESV